MVMWRDRIILAFLFSIISGSSTSMQLNQVIKASDTSDGAGVRLKRSLGSRNLQSLDPFLMLDEFKSEIGADYIAGFPNHPHRGFETVTYMIHGKMKHKDNRGNEGIIESGGVQWMTAGRGIIHSEMPMQEEGLMWGFQLWINLPASKKMCEPRYQDIPAADVPEILLSGGRRVRVIAGSIPDASNTMIEGCVKDIITNPTFLDIGLPLVDQEFSFQVPNDLRGFLYCFSGSISVGDEKLEAQHLATLTDGTTITISSNEENSRVLFIAAIPINEPIAKHGPFVMNTQDEIQQAFMDYQMGLF